MNSLIIPKILPGLNFEIGLISPMKDLVQHGYRDWKKKSDSHDAKVRVVRWSGKFYRLLIYSKSYNIDSIIPKIGLFT